MGLGVPEDGEQARPLAARCNLDIGKPKTFTTLSHLHKQVQEFPTRRLRREHQPHLLAAASKAANSFGVMAAGVMAAVAIASNQDRS